MASTVTAPTAPKVQRAVWNADTDMILLETLFKQRDQGMQTSNGNWHNAAWSSAEKALSGTEVVYGGIKKTASSCQNRWNSLKKEYKEVKHIRDLSGFGWDDAKKVVTATPEVWEALLAKSPNYRKWRKHSFPLFDEMQDLIEGTYATGHDAFHPGGDDTANNPELGADDFDGDDDNHWEIDPSLMASKSQTPSSVNTPSSPPTSGRPTPAPESSAPATVSLASADLPSLKRRTADPTSEIPLPKRRRNEDRYNRKPSGSQAMVDMASSIDRLASSVAGPNVTLASSPERKRAAIKLIEKDEDLSGDELTKTFKLIRCDTSFADTILAISDKSHRTQYIQSELDDF
ncbi:Myb/SANT-like DNA-binding domain-containing protein [Amanita rubescens]|nr:Myb/SANT-like DNA-binding domain-containing protein [Amanita rubescens]